MKLKFSQFFSPARPRLFWGLPLLVLLLAGCDTTQKGNPMDPPAPSDTPNDPVARLHIGDSVIVTLDGPPDPIAPHEEIIKEDGTITMPNIGRVKAAGKTSGELQDEITAKYVPDIYRHLTVTVKPGDRVFFVRGEVKGPGRQIYTGPITVTKAITAAGDFTDFSNRRNVVLIRASGQRYVVDCVKILNGEKPDPGVFPGDQIEVRHSRL